ncbi:hypothetical protein [Thermococcus sp.]
MEAFKCERCGAPLEVSPETIVAVCHYCGFPNHITGNLKTEDMFLVPSLSKGQIAEAFWRNVERDFDLRRIKNSIQIIEIEGHYAPYWVGEVHVEGRVDYTVIEEECETYTDSRGGTRTRCRTVEKHYSDYVDETLNLIGSARRQVESFGVTDIVRHYSKTRPKEKRLLDLDESQWEKLKLEVLNTEMDEEQARLMMREDAIDVIRNRYSAKADRIDRFEVKANEPRNIRLLLLPMWTVYYKFENSIFHAVFAGWDGKRVASTEPMTALRRVEYLGGVALGILIGAVGGAYGANSGAFALTGITIGLGSVLSGYFGLKVLEGQRVERGG